MSKKTPMSPYYDLLREVAAIGSESENRTGTNAISVFGRQLRFDLNDGFPLLTGKFVPFDSVAAEVLWFLSGSTNNEDLRKLNGNDRATIWEEWQLDGKLGPMYSEQWRGWFDQSGEKIFEIDQIAILIENLKKNPNSRRHLVSAWNVRDLPDESVSPQSNVRDGKMALAPCHYSFQMHVDGDKLSCMVNLRSSDLFLGLPFNIASYALLTHLIAQVTNLKVGELIVSIGNAHIYSDHVEQVHKLLSRDVSVFPLCTLQLNSKITNIDDFTMNDLKVVDYKSYSSIPAKVAI